MRASSRSERSTAGSPARKRSSQPGPADAEALGARLDHELTDRAIWLPTVTGKTTDIVSKRAGNYQYHPFWGAFVDQLRIR